MTKVQAAWLAGIIDGEGSIDISPPRLRVTNTNIDLLEQCQRITNLGTILQHNKNQPSHWADCYRWSIAARKDVAWVLRQVHPYLIAKRDKSVLAILECESNEYKPHRATNPNHPARKRPAPKLHGDMVTRRTDRPHVAGSGAQRRSG